MVKEIFIFFGTLTNQGARGLDAKQFERFVRQAYLIVSQAA
jgi:hypothetical protein